MRIPRPGYGLPVFLGAFLLFQVQFIVARQVLPWFGGVPAVWTVCMLFFQALLVAGYLYAHIAATRLAPRWQAAAQLALAASALAFLPAAAPAGWKPSGEENAVWRLLAILAAAAGLPCLALSAGGPLLQHWSSRAEPGASPYRLYALSNLGSLLALLSYPFVVEPAFGLKTQAWLWSAGFAVWAGLIALACRAAWSLPSGPDAGAVPRYGDRRQTAAGSAAGAGPGGSHPGILAKALWLALPACGSILLLAATNQLCQAVAAAPFLWALPLALYLSSYILCFGFPRLYQRPVFWPLLAAGAAAICRLIYLAEIAPFNRQLAGYSFGLFACCMVCHGEYARLRPEPSRLTAFYLAGAAGGALGGAFVGLAAPAIFADYAELPIAVFACALLAMLAFLAEAAGRGAGPGFGARPRRGSVMLWGAAFLASLAVLGYFLRRSASSMPPLILLARRNFYGTLILSAELVPPPQTPRRWFRVLRNGTIIHGAEFATRRGRRIPTTYFGESSGIGLALRHYCASGPIRVGIIGLGAGTLAAYGRKGDRYTFYEVNPAVRDLARERFRFLPGSEADCEVVMGDGRLSLERSPPQGFDVLALDAFSGDAIPTHLLTREAFAVYLRHLKPGGVIAVHVTNRYLDLGRVVAALAADAGLAASRVSSAVDKPQGLLHATWMLVSGDERLLGLEPVRSGLSGDPAPGPRSGYLWTDDRSDLLRLLF